MKGAAAVLALALVVLGCGSDPEPTPEPVQLLTGRPDNNLPTGCYPESKSGLVTFDPRYGTAMITDQIGDLLPLAIGWPSGFTGWRSGFEVRVLNRAGQVVLVTGRRYEMFEASVVLADWPKLPDRAFWACGGATPLP